jgi:hypothetical protein
MAAGLVAAGASPDAATAQLPDTTRYLAVATSLHPRGTVVSISVRIPAGSDHDDEGFGGTAWLLGHIFARRAEAAAGLDSKVTVDVSPGETLFTILTLPEEWAAAWGRAESVIFGTLLDGQDIEEGRRALLADLAFDAGSPVRNFELEARRLVAPSGRASSRSMRGTTETVATVSPRDLRLFAQSHYRADATTVAVVGPRGTVLPFTAERTDAVQEPTRAGPAWLVGGRFDLLQDITNSWIAVAWPVTPGVSRTSLEFLSHLLSEQLDPEPPDPDRFSLDVHIEDTPEGPVVLVEAAVFPEAADRWEGRILSAVESLARRTMDEDFIGWRRRRFRTARLLAESRPEAEAVRIARDLAREGAPRALSIEIWGLDATHLHRAARALGEPRILRLGPDLGADQGRR